MLPVLSLKKCRDVATLSVSSDLNGDSPQFILTCISTNGPPTNVTWTRDSVVAIGDTEIILNDPITAEYTHYLTVTGRLGGLYTCTVANNKPSYDSANITVQGIHNNVSIYVCISIFVYVQLPHLQLK